MRMKSIFKKQGPIQDFDGGGGGGEGAKIMCAYTYIRTLRARNPKFLSAGVQGLLKGPGSYRAFFMLSRAIWGSFSSILIQNGITIITIQFYVSVCYEDLLYNVFIDWWHDTEPTLVWSLFLSIGSLFGSTGFLKLDIEPGLFVLLVLLLFVFCNNKDN